MPHPIGRAAVLAALCAALLAGGCGEEEQPSPRAERPPRAAHRAPAREASATAERSPQPTPAPTPGPSGIPAGAKRSTVTEVVDGDTVHLAGLGSSRLIGVDTPEVYGQAECYGHRASAFTDRELTPGTTVYYRHGIERTDRYGRDLVYVWLPGGTFYNALLVKEGYAVTLTIAPNDRYADLFRRLSGQAHAADRGLWSPRTCGGDADEPVGAGTARSGGGAGAATADDRDCADFSSQAGAQRYFVDQGGPAQDPDYLDGDGDGVACEDLP